MTVESTTCPACGEAVVKGRLACPACGEMLAAITGSDGGSVPAAPAGAVASAPPTLAAPSPERRTDGPTLGDWAGPPPAGSYLPPSGVYPPPLRSPSSAVAGPASMVPAAASAGTGFAVGAPSAPAAPAAVIPGQAPFLADLPLEAPSDIGSWLVATGAVLAASGFLLPWSGQVIGAAGIGSYFDSWGLAAPSHLVAFSVAVVLTGSAVVPSRIPSWIRAGVAPLAVGGLLLGLVWPYLLDGLGGQLGSFLEGVAAILLLVGGVVTIASDRHGPRPRPV